MKTYDNFKKAAGLVVLILDRFVVQMFGHNFEEAEVDVLEKIVQEFNLKKIAKLG